MRSHQPTSHCFSLPSARGFGRKLEGDISGDIDGAAKRTGERFGSAFKIGAGAALAGGVLLGSFLKDAMAEARDAQIIGARTENVIAKMGNAANVSAKQVGNLAEAISLKTGIDDEAIQSGQNLLLTFGNIRNEAGKGNDIFSQTSQLMVDMSAAMGTDAKGSAIQLGKALNDPIKGLTALSRVGVSFTEGQRSQIEAMAESGNIMGAQKVILGELERQFGGAAESMATPAAKAAVAWGNFKEQIGTALIPVMDRLLRTFTNALPRIQEFASSIATSIGPAIESFVVGIKQGEGAGGALAAVLTQLATAATTVAGFINQNRTAVAAFGVAVLAVNVIMTAHAAALTLAAAGGLTKYLMTTRIVTTVTKAWAAVQWLLNAALTANPIGVVVVAIAALAAGLVYAYQKSETFRAVVDAVFGFLKTAVGATVSFVSDHWKTIVVIIGGPLVAIGLLVAKHWGAIKSTVTSVVSAVIGFVRNHWKLIVSLIGGPIVAAVVLVVSNWNKIKSATESAWNAVKAVVSAQIRAVIAAVGGIASLVGKVSNWFGEILSAIRSKLGQAVAFVQTFPGKVIGVFAGLASRLYAAGAEMMNMLAAGIRDRLSAAYDALKSAAGKLASLVPGSPVKEGPLRSLNNGHSGGQIMEMLAKGIKDNESKPADAMRDAMGKVVERLKEKRDELKGILDGLRSDFDSLASSVASAFAGNLFDVQATAAQAATETDAAIPGQSASSAFIENLLGTRGELSKLMAAFKKLRKWGLSAPFLSQLFASGNGGLILDLAAGGRSNAEYAESLFGQVGSLSNQLGSQVARNELGPKMDRVGDRLDDVRAELKKTNRLLANIPKETGREINGSVRHGQRSAA